MLRFDVQRSLPTYGTHASTSPLKISVGNCSMRLRVRVLTLSRWARASQALGWRARTLISVG